jgi:superkiller protein 3
MLLLTLGTLPKLAAAQSLEQLVQQGRTAQAEKQYSQAEAVWRHVLGQDPKNADAYLGLGNALSGQKALAEAIDAYRQAITLNPKNAEAYLGLGHVLSDRKRFAEAIAAYRQAIKLNPQPASAYLNLGAVLSEQKQFDEAIAAYRQALSLPDDTATLLTAHTLAYNGLGLIFQQQGQLTAAIGAYQLALQVDPSYAYAQSNLLEAQRLLALKQVPQRLALAETRYLTRDTVTPLKRSVVKIIARFPHSAKGSGYGTGFVIKRKGNKAWIVTNRHVVFEPDTQQRGEDLQVELYYGNPPDGIPVARLEKAPVRLLQMTEPNDPLDLAVLEVTDLPADIQPLPVRQQTAGDRLNVRIIGHSGAQAWPVDETESLGFVNSQLKDRLLLRLYLRKGASGSPILDAQNRVLGVLFGDITLEKTGLGTAYPINVVMNKLAAWGVKLP